MEDVVKLIDRRIELKTAIDRLTDELKEIDQEIKEECDAGEVLLGSSGVGYRLHRQQTLEYGVYAVQHLKERGLLDAFVKVTTTGLEKLVKSKALSYTELDMIQSKAKVKETLTIREFVPEEVKIIA